MIYFPALVFLLVCFLAFFDNNNTTANNSNFTAQNKGESNKTEMQLKIFGIVLMAYC